VSRAQLEVVTPGPLSTVQDLGRPGHASWGVGRSGAADRESLRLANRLVGNAADTAALEVLLGGLELRPDRDVVVALTGARCAARIGRRAVDHNTVLRVPAGSVLRLGTARAGLRTYVAVRGGIDVPAVLGSRSYDVLSGIGPPVLAAGTLLAVGPPPDRYPCVDMAPVPDPPAGAVRLRVMPGPHDDWFVPGALGLLERTAWTVTTASDRIGMRLAGAELPRARTTELPSAGVVRGALQVAPAGQPTLFMADHPLTGGYPVIAVVLDADVDRAAQVRPGQGLQFTIVPNPSPSPSPNPSRGTS
jgi:biotin-dependent carboxylase-like uncharacterized protein